ncbi:uncharacterized protein CC84DRAFT_1192373 [Paraphaeosphaeria sporulosa]|uniref:Uncharacterized protein n=1 Tax=Paraphaeosphaeria sporulosa TaxID=1460663 RepID=A0A177CWW1_9PLEO|nr:uncharacterized protein CC84DRAFT_1192373 [Paraphaeosphaeria sporulosa]OAG12054.1 hypothetical protein CC84DRAFT_1192373 [Paraphaeosphaeria sporulosa]
MRLRLVVSALPFVLICIAHAAPEPRPEAKADPEAFPEAQSYVNNAPFSGAIYIVSPDGQPAQGSCPAVASLSCGDQGHPSWCCPGGCSCVQQQGGYVGCCPAGSNCAGPVTYSTVTVTAQAQQTVPVVVPQQFTTTAYCPTCYSPPPVAAGFCQTLTMHGPGLPVVTQGECGTILIVNESSSLKPVGFGLVGIFLTIQLVIVRMFRWI